MTMLIRNFMRCSSPAKLPGFVGKYQGVKNMMVRQDNYFLHFSRKSCRNLSSSSDGNLFQSMFKQEKSEFQWEPLRAHQVTPRLTVDDPLILKPPYAQTGYVPESPSTNIIQLHGPESIKRMKKAAGVARRCLELACSLAKPGITTDEIDKQVHEAILAEGAYPSPLNYSGFPKSCCSSVNEVICHGIPDTRPLQHGDLVSFDVSCFIGGVHGDNCGTVIVGENSTSSSDQTCDTLLLKRIEKSRKLLNAAKEALEAGIHAVKPGGCLSDIGSAIHDVVDSYGFDTVREYRGHGISSEFHIAPFVKHFRNNDRIRLEEGMIFTIEPMVTEGSAANHLWEDNWTVVTNDRSWAAQFEDTVLITGDGVEIITVREN